MQELGLVILDKLDFKHYKVVMKCGHTKIIEGNLKTFSEYCSNCRDSAILEKCPEGTTITSFSKMNQNVHLTFPCGHETTRKTYADDRFTCLDCRKENKKGLLSRLLIDDLGDDRYKLGCGHVTGDIAWQSLDGYKCFSCEHDLIYKRAKNFDLEATGTYDSEQKMHEFTLKCGHTKYLRTTAIKAGVVCPTCAEDHYSKPCDMYFLIGFCEDGFSFLKVGVANDTKSRLKTYQAKGLNGWMLIASVGFPSKRVAVKVEKAFHKDNIEKRIQPEIMKKYLKEGFTECYPTSTYFDNTALIEKLHQEYGHSVHFKKVSIDGN